MHKIGIALLSTLLFSLTCHPMLAQSQQHPWSIHAGAAMLKYTAPSEMPDLQGATYQPALSFGFAKYLGGAFDFRTQFLASHSIAFPTPLAELPSHTTNSLLLDMNYTLAFKINNGAFMRQDAFIGPYILFGIGGSYVKDNPDAYVPLGGGIKFRLNPRWDLRVESTKKISLNKDFQAMTHALSVGYNVGKPKQQYIQETIPQEEVLEKITPKDTDGDGILDEDDLCPNEPGIAKLHGCKEEEIQAEAVALEEEKETQANTHTQTPSELVETETGQAYDTEEQVEIPVLEEPKTDMRPIQPALKVLDKEEDVKERPLPCNLSLSSDQYSLFFELASAELLSEAKSKLDEVAAIMQACPASKLQLHGHTDDIGGNRVNHALSVLRAHKVKYYIVYEHGISQSRIESAGYGETQPVANNQTDSGREQNRRVDFTLIR